VPTRLATVFRNRREFHIDRLERFVDLPMIWTFVLGDTGPE
jgi:hypothetical protein